MPERMYNEEEVSRLIRRAAELEAERSAAGRGTLSEGLTLNELEQVAAESGIDPELLQQAARELDRAPDNTPKPATIKKKEIVSEHWLNINADSRLMEDLVTELNQKYGTSHKDINWWDNLWNDYSGKARVRKTSHSIEWEYKDEMELFTIRALLQNRGDRFRIRVSKSQGWGLEWDQGKKRILSFFSAGVGLIMGGFMVSHFLFNDALAGALTGLVLTLISIPFISSYLKKSLEKHQQEVTETAYELAEFAMNFYRELKQGNAGKANRQGDTDYRVIEINEDESLKPDQSTVSSLKNNLREKS